MYFQHKRRYRFLLGRYLTESKLLLWWVEKPRNERLFPSNDKVKYMRTRFTKEMALLILPVIVLVGALTPIWPTHGEPVISIESMTVSQVEPWGTPKGKNLYYPDQPDTKVTVVLKHNPPSLYQKFVEMKFQYINAGCLADNTGTCLTDKKGTLIERPRTARRLYLLTGRCSVDLLFAVRKVPKSVGQVKLKSAFKVEGRTLPIEITVREK